MNKKLLWAGYLGMLIFGMAMLSLGSVNTYLTQTHNLSQMTLASLAAFLPIGILAGSMVFGPVVDRFGYKIMLVVCSSLIAVSFLIISLTSQLFWFQLSFLLIGFSGGAINGGTNALVADISESNKSARLSLLGVFYGIGALGMPLVIGSLNQYFSHQQIIRFFSFIAFIPVIYFLITQFPEPKQKQGFPISKGLRLFKEPLILLIGFFLFFESGIEGITNNWSTQFLRDSSEISAEISLYALSVMVLTLTLTRLVLGKLLKKINAPIVLYGSLGIIFLGSALLTLFSSVMAAFIGLGLLGMGFAAGFPVMLGYVGELFSEISGTAFSVVLFIALAGNTSINYVIGLFANASRINVLPVITGISAVVMTILLTMLVTKLKDQE